MRDSFLMHKRIYYHDTDCGGVVYYGKYLEYLEEARTEYFLDKGIDLRKLSSEEIWFVVSRVEINYKSPAYYQDTLTIFTEIGKLKSASMEFLQEIKRDTQLIVEAKTVLVCVDKSFKPMCIPEKMRDFLLD